MPGSILVARILGIDIRIHLSWFLIFGLVLINFERVLPAIRPTWSEEKTLLVAAVTALLFFASVLAHELAHAVVARAFRMPVSSITLFLLGGVANLAKEPPTARAEFLMAVAGPLMSVALGGVGVGLAALAEGQLTATPALDTVAIVAGLLGPMNLLLAVFNMVPGYPLDGGRVFRSIVWGVARDRSRATRIAARGGQVVAAALFLGGIVRSIAEGDPFSGAWLALIAYFLYTAASGAIEQERLTAAVAGVRVGSIMSTSFRAVRPSMTVAELVEEHFLPFNTRAVAVVDGGKLTGLVTIGDLRKVPQASWPVTSVDAIMRPLSDLGELSPGSRLMTAIERFTIGDLPAIPVVEDGTLVGMLEREAVLSYVRMREMLGLDARR